MKKQPFKLPVIKSYEAEYQSMDSVLNQIRNSKTVMMFYKDSKGQNKFLFTGFGVDEFALLLIGMDSHPQIFQFFKDAVVNSELYRINELEGFEYTQAITEIIKKPKN